MELPRRPDHGQQPDGRPPRLGPRLQGPLPALPRHARRGPALPERVRLPGPVGRGQRRARPRVHVASATSRRTASTEFVTPVQAARPDLRRAPDRAVDPARDVDGLERPGRAAPAARRCSRADPAAGRHDRGPGRPGDRHASRCSSGGSGMPEIGGSYFTFSNENNDLIWGFLAECHRRGWLYKGHDTMPWCPRCGTGLSPDGDERGLPGSRGSGPDRALPAARPDPGEALLVWTTTPWTLDRERGRGRRPDAALRPGAPGRRPVLGRQGDAQGRALAGRSRFEAEVAGADLVGWRYAGPFDDAAGGRDGVRRGRATTGLRASASSPGTRSARTRGPASSTSRPGCGAEDFQLGKSLGLPVIGPIDEDGRYFAGFGWLSGLEAPQRGRPDRRRPRAPRALLPPRAVHPPLPALLALRHARCCSGSSTSGSSRWARCTTQPRETLTAGAGRRQPALPDHGRRRPDPLDPRLRLRARARLAAQHARLDDQQEALLGAGAADLRLPGVRHGRGHRRPRRAAASARSRAGRRSRATPRIGPTSTRSRSPARAAGSRSSGSSDVGNPWLDAGIVPFSTLHYREDPDYWRKWFPADFITESFPGQFRNWFYSMLAMSTVLKREPSRSRRSSATPACSARTAGRCTRAGATRSSSTRRPTGWASTSCAGCSPRPGPRRTSCSAGTRPTRRAASCSSCGTSTRSS